jgi:hypothetical protein
LPCGIGGNISCCGIGGRCIGGGGVSSILRISTLKKEVAILNTSIAITVKTEYFKYFLFFKYLNKKKLFSKKIIKNGKILIVSCLTLVQLMLSPPAERKTGIANTITHIIR